MESTPRRPTAAEAAAALGDAAAARAALANGVAMPAWTSTWLGAAIAAHIATTAVGVGEEDPLVLVAGLAIFAAVAAVQLARFRRRNGVWLSGFASRVVLGSATTASASYAMALGAAIWAAADARWWLVALASAAGGAMWALSGRRWLRAYHAEPAGHGGRRVTTWVVLVTSAAVLGAVLLLVSG